MSVKGAAVVGGIAVAGLGTLAVWRIGQARFADAWAMGDYERAWAIADRQRRLRNLGQAAVLVGLVAIVAASQLYEG